MRVAVKGHAKVAGPWGVLLDGADEQVQSMGVRAVDLEVELRGAVDIELDGIANDPRFDAERERADLG